MHNMHSQVGILGAYVDSVTLDEAVQRAHEFIQSGQPHQITTVNVDFIRVAQENLEFRAVINKSDLAIADGMPIVWASRCLSASQAWSLLTAAAISPAGKATRSSCLVGKMAWQMRQPKSSPDATPAY